MNQLSFSKTNCILLLIFVLGSRVNSLSYCVDELCSLECCMDYYNCAVTKDCLPPQVVGYDIAADSDAYPYTDGHKCIDSDECSSSCCINDECSQMANCQGLMIGLGVGLGAILLVFIVYNVLKKYFQGLQQQPISDPTQNLNQEPAKPLDQINQVNQILPQDTNQMNQINPQINNGYINNDQNIQLSPQPYNNNLQDNQYQQLNQLPQYNQQYQQIPQQPQQNYWQNDNQQGYMFNNNNNNQGFLFNNQPGTADKEGWHDI